MSYYDWSQITRIQNKAKVLFVDALLNNDYGYTKEEGQDMFDNLDEPDKHFWYWKAERSVALASIKQGGIFNES